MTADWSTEFKNSTIYRIDESVRMVSIALSKIQEDEIWTKQNRSLPTLGNIILHICGNLRQYIVSGLGGEVDDRNRDLEFSTEGGHTLDDLLQKLLSTSINAKRVIEEATEEDLLAKFTVQGFEFTGIGHVIHAVEHFSYHTGQIAFQVKLIIDEPLGFYAGMNLNVRNESTVEELNEDLEAEKEDDPIPQ